MSDHEPDSAPEDDLEALEAVCEVEFFRGSGPGGQHRNRRESAVRLRHPPTGLVVTATERRSQSQNRRIALLRMARALAELQHTPKKRVRTRPGRAARERRLAEKRRQAQKKSNRRSPGFDD